MFDKPLRVQSADNNYWIVLDGFTWDDGKDRVEVPRWMLTDFGSIPSFLCPLTGHAHDEAQAFVLHDRLFRNPEGRSQFECNDILDRALKWLGRGFIRRKAIKLGLTAFGFVAWNRYRSKDKVIQPDP